MAKKFSQDYGKIPTISPSDRLLISRASDGATFYALITDILAGLATGQSVAQAITSAVSNLQPKETGKGLSANDFTNTLKQKLDGIDLSGFQPKEQGKGLSTNDFTNTLKQKLDNLNENGGGTGGVSQEAFNELAIAFNDLLTAHNEMFVTEEGEQVFKTSLLPYNTSLSPSQFEPVSDGIGLKGFANIGQGGGSTTQPAMTSSMIVDDDTANTRTLQNLPSGKTFADVETSINGGTSYTTHTSNVFQIGNVALAAGQVMSRFRSVGSVLAGTPVANTIAFTVSGGGTGPTLLRTVRLNFQSQYSSPGDTPGITWNDLKPTNAQLNAAGGFVSGNLVTQANAATTIKVTNVTAFGNGNAEVSGAYETGLYPEVIANSGWEFNGTGDYTLNLTGLDATNYYSFLLAAVSSNSAADAVLFTIGAKTSPVSSFNNFGVAGEDENASAIFAKINSIQPTSGGVITIGVKGTAGGWGKFLSVIIVKEYDTAS